MKTRTKIHKFKDLLITSDSISREGQYCATCCKDQPFNNWNCRICDSHSLAGDPFDAELENFDEEFESLQEIVLELVCKTKRGNYLYRYKDLFS